MARSKNAVTEATARLAKAGEKLYTDHMLIEPIGDGWLASYRLGCSAGSSGKMYSPLEAIKWLLNNELARIKATPGRVANFPPEGGTK